MTVKCYDADNILCDIQTANTPEELLDILDNVTNQYETVIVTD